MEFLSHPSPQCSWNKAEKEVERLYLPEVVNDSIETGYSRWNRTNTYKNSQRLWYQAQDQHRFKSNKFPAYRRKNVNKVSPLNKKLFVIDTFEERGSQFSSYSVSEYVNYTPGRTTYSGIVGQHKLCILVFICVNFCSCVCVCVCGGFCCCCLYIFVLVLFWLWFS